MKISYACIAALFLQFVSVTAQGVIVCTAPGSIDTRDECNRWCDKCCTYRPLPDLPTCATLCGNNCLKRPE
ncbi:hypothetical protein FRC03_006889 [Tulasnella sp. 419]|nr:hypothetical protein FRC03_006889 [Tulasnella sp. 419]